jgi:hypothetical protein
MNRVRRAPLIDLGRRFCAVSKDEAAWDERQQVSWLPVPTVGWNELLELPCAVVLGEAGVGKTAELRRATELVTQKNGAGFFLPVEAVAADGLLGALTKSQRDAFGEWRATTAPGWFLLDSVDEAKLKRRTLASAINALTRELDLALSRVHVVVSSRTSDWRLTEEDVVADLRSHLAGVATAGAADVFLFELAPLDRQQITRLAEHHGLVGADLEAFLTAAKDANAWSFLERPLDVLSQVDTWRKRRRFGTHREVVSTSIDVKLAEDPERNSQMSASRARAGAQRLALAAVLSQRVAFQLPGEELDEYSTEALVPARVLSDWSDADIKELLTRGLFDEATYGRVRIHHRQAQEYLAAEELSQMVQQGWPKGDLESLLFRNSSGEVVTPAHLQAVAAWCSLQSRDVRRKALEVMPEHLLDRGDPAGLPTEDRRAALLAYVDRFGKQARVYHGFDHFGLKRFACPELADDILNLLDDSASPEHLKSLLLEIVEYGEVTKCAAAARAIALDAATAPYLRLAAIEATAKAGSDDDRIALLGLVRTEAARDRDVAAKLVTLLHPKHMPDEALVALLTGVQHPKKDRADRLEALVVRHVADETSPSRQRAILGLLAGAFVNAGSGDAQLKVSRYLYWLVEPLTVLLAARINDAELPLQVRIDALRVVETCSDNHDFYNGRPLNVLEQNANLKQVLFWRHVQAHVAADGKTPKRLWDFRLPYLLRLADGDISWLWADCVERASLHERFLALNAIIDLTSVRDEAFLGTLEGLAARSDERHGGSAMRTHLGRRKAWSPEPRYDQWQVQHRAFDLRDRRRHLAWHERFRANIAAIEAGTDEQAMDHFYREYPNEKSSERSERVSISKITERYDPDVAEAARRGFIAFWRRHEPIRIEDHPPNSTPWKSSWGLIGLAFDVEAGLDVAQLPETLFRRAVTFAPWEMSALPPWLDRCATTQPDVVAERFAAALEADFGAPAESNEQLGRLLYKLPHEPLATRAACAPLLARLLSGRDPPRTSVLELVLKAFDGTSAVDASALLELARSRAAACEPDVRRFSIWWREWVQLNPQEAVEHLVGAAARAAHPDAFLLKILDDLGDRFDRRSGRGLDQLRRNPLALARLCELVDAHVARRADLDDLENGHSAGREGRNQLPNWLAAINDPVATAALRRLAEREGLPAYERDWLRHLAAIRAVADVSKAMTPDEVASFLSSPVIEPKTERDLFEVAKNRLRDIQHVLAHGDFSIRSAFNPSAEAVLEEPVQNLLAKELHDNRRGHYEVVREPEVSRKKKPDIRLLNPRCPGPMTIEIKIAQRWTVEQLEDALSSQLVEQYMKANTSNFGIYVVCSSGPKDSWTTPEGTTVDFNGLVARLSRVAAQMLDRNPATQGLAVVPIDFH